MRYPYLIRKCNCLESSKTLTKVEKHAVMRNYATILALFILSYCNARVEAGGIGEKVYIKVKCGWATPDDTLFVSHHGVFLNRLSQSRQYRTSSTMNQEGEFVFELAPVDTCGFFTLESNTALPKGIRVSANPRALLESQLWEAGDSIQIEIDTVTSTGRSMLIYSFGGRGAEKYQATDHIRQTKPCRGRGSVLSVVGREVLDGLGDYYPTVMDEDSCRLAVLASYSRKISKLSYAVLQSEILFRGKSGMFAAIRHFFKDSLNNDVERSRYYENYQRIKSDLLLSMDTLAPAAVHSPAYLDFLYYLYDTEAYLDGWEVRENQVFNQIMERPSGVARDYLVTSFLLRLRSRHEHIALFEHAYDHIASLYCKRLVEDDLSNLSMGSLPSYSLKDTANKDVDLGTLYDKIVIIDFWFTGCVHCRVFYKDVIMPAKEVFGQHPDVIFVSISSDRDYRRWITSVESGLYTDKSSINLYTGGSGVDHPIYMDNHINKVPTIIILGKGGKIEQFNSRLLFDADGLIQELRGCLKSSAH